MTTATATLIKNVGVLLRISREKGEGQDTLLNHRTIAERYCKSKGYNYRIYEEVISGATNVENREALSALLDDIKAGMYDAIFVKDIDRISRDSYYLQFVAKILADHEIIILTPEREYDLNGNDRLMFDMMGAVSSQELRLIKRRQRDGKKEHALRGQWTQGVTPFGYSRNEDVTSPNYKKLEINENEAPIIKKIFEYALSGYGIPAIVDKLSGYRTRTFIVKVDNEKTGRKAGDIHKGKQFGISQVNTILKNDVYKGTITYQVKNKQKTHVVETIVVENAHESIISPEDFEKVQLAVAGRISGGQEGLAKRTRSRGATLSILKDLIYCNDCNSKIGFRKDSKNPDKIFLKACSCGNRGISESQLYAEFLHQFAFTEKIFREQWQKALEGTNTDNKEDLEQQVQELLKQQQKLIKRKSNINLMRADGELTKIEAEEMKADVEQELSQLNSNLSKLQKQIASMDTEKIANDYEEKLKLIGLVKQNLGVSELSKGEGLESTASELPSDNIIEVNRLLKVLLDKVYYKRHDEFITGSSANGEPEIEYDYVELQIVPK